MERAEITEKEAKERYENLLLLGKRLFDRANELIELDVQGGLTFDGARFDIVLTKKQLDSAKTEIDRVVGRKPLPGKMGICIPYDLPNFLGIFYGAPPYMAGIPVELHFASINKSVAKIWDEVIKSEGIEGMKIDTKMSGRDFGNYCIENGEVRHFIIAGGEPVVDLYTSPQVTSKLDTVTVFGPTRPKVLIMDSNTIDYVKSCNAMFDSGQVCGLDKEIIPTSKNYDYIKEQLKKMVQNTTYGTPKDTVGPIRDMPAFRRAVEILQQFKSNKQHYEIIAGGGYDEKAQVVEPTLVEAHSEIDPHISCFAPILILNKGAKNNPDAVIKAKHDNIHGYLVSVYADPIEAFEYEGLLKQDFGLVRLNSSIMAESIDWPYGGYGKSFAFCSKGRLIRGRIYLSRELTVPA